MALLRFVCRDLLKVFNNENKFIDQVRDFIESKALKPKHARRVIKEKELREQASNAGRGP